MTLRPFTLSLSKGATLGFAAKPLTLSLSKGSIGGGLMGALAWWLGAPAMVSIPAGLAIGFTLGALYGAML